MVGVVGSSPIVPTNKPHQIKHLLLCADLVGRWWDESAPMRADFFRLHHSWCSVQAADRRFFFGSVAVK